MSFRWYPVILLLISMAGYTAEDHQFAVIMDDRFPIYRQVLTGIAVESKEDFLEYSLGGNADKGPATMQAILQKKPKVIIAMGPKSANAAKVATRTVPIIFCLVPRLEGYEMERENLVGIRLESPYKNQLMAIKILFPGKKRIGVMHHPQSSLTTIENAKKAAQKLDLVFVSIPVSAPSYAEKTLNDNKDKFDVLWMVSDSIALNMVSVEAMTRFAVEHKKPYFAVNDGFVMRGALMSFAVDHVRLGMQAGRLANETVKDGYIRTSVDILAPEGLGLAVNLGTAKKIGIFHKLAPDMLTFSAENRYSITMFE